MGFAIYFIIFGLVSFAALSDLDTKIKQKSILFVWFCFCVFYIFRARVGTDWLVYENYYMNITNSSEIQRLNLEAGYYLLNRIYHGIGLPFQFITITLGTVVCLLYSSAVKKRDFAKGLLLLASLYYLFFPTLEALRQSIAIFIFFYIILAGTLGSNKDDTFKESVKKDFKYFFGVVIGGLFHQTAILVELLYYGFRKSRKLKVIALAVLFSYGILQTQIESLLSQYLPNVYHKFLYYTVLSEKNYAEASIFSVKFIIYCIALLIILLWKNKDEYELGALNLVELGLVIQIAFTGKMSGVYRLLYYTDIGIILFIVCLDKRINSGTMKFLFRLFVIAIIAILFYRNFQFDNELFMYHFLA